MGSNLHMKGSRLKIYRRRVVVQTGLHAASMPSVNRLDNLRYQNSRHFPATQCRTCQWYRRIPKARTQFLQDLL
jgi:transglutaminase/protease-like cytokinesis protein 3